MRLRTVASLLTLFGTCLLAVRASSAQPAVSTCACEAVEQRKLDMERWKFGGTVLSLLVPLGIAALTLRSSARNNLELKAAEIVLNSRSPAAAKAKATVLQKLFPTQLRPAVFSTESFNEMPGYAYEQRLEVFKAMIEHPTHTKEIAKLWITIVGNQNQQLKKELENFL